MSSIPDLLLSQLSEHLARHMGWHFPPERWRELATGIESAARELGLADVTAYARSLLSPQLSKAQIEALAGALTIGETYFFRDPRSFDILGTHVFPELIRARRRSERRLRIWSAGCCTGEEAYSIAILLDRLLPDISNWQITLLATDINTRFLHKAVAGSYSEWSFRNAPPWLKDNYFKPAAGRRLALIPRIKSMVTFAYLNLGEDAYPSLHNNTNAMDLILCRNVLMYFSPERAGQVVRNFHRSLISGGLFMTSAVETSPQLNTHFAATSFEGAVLYRKKSEFDVATSAPPAPWVPSTATPPDALVALTQTEIAALLQPDVNVAGVPVESVNNVLQAASALFARGSYNEAVKLLEAGDVSADESAARATLLARTYANLGDLSQARLWAEQAVAADRTNAVSQYLCAVIQQEQNLVTEAVATLQKTLYLDPGFVLAHFALGNIEQRQGRRQVATRHFNNALKLLQAFADNDVLPHSEGMAAGALRRMIRSVAPADAA